MYTILFSCFWIPVVLILSGEGGVIRPEISDSKSTQPARVYCVEIKDCPYIHQLVRFSPPPLHEVVAQIIRKHHCGFKGINLLVCCWYRTKEITIPAEDFDIDETYP